jgi:hypothetical protein
LAGAFLTPLILGSPRQIIAARVLPGAGAAFMVPATLLSLVVGYPPEARTKGVGVWAGVAEAGQFPACSGRACCCGFGNGGRTFGLSRAPD